MILGNIYEYLKKIEKKAYFFVRKPDVENWSLNFLLKKIVCFVWRTNSLLIESFFCLSKRKGTSMILSKKLFCNVEDSVRVYFMCLTFWQKWFLFLLSWEWKLESPLNIYIYSIYVKCMKCGITRKIRCFWKIWGGADNKQLCSIVMNKLYHFRRKRIHVKRWERTWISY